jgi:predicted nucleic-acid-binding protein
MVGVDSNIVLRLLLNDDPIQAEQAKLAVRNASSPCLINTTVLSEVVWVLRRGYKFDRKNIIKAVEALLQTQNFCFEDSETIWRTLNDYRVSSADFSDCLIGQGNKQSRCETTITFDRKAGNLGSFTLLDSQ